jgi:hypothetical protein
MCTAVGIHACGGCGIVQYCSKACQKSSWKAGHKLACKGMGKAKKDAGEKVCE